MENLLIHENIGAVAVLTLNSPKNINALSDAMLAVLTDKFAAISQDTATKAVILRGAGKGFCAGHNLKEMTAARTDDDGGKSYFLDLFARCTAMMQSIREMPQPVIAQIHGIATAAGCQLVATCDLAVADEDTKFGVNGVNIGLFCSTPMVALSRNIPRKKAFEMLTTGRFISAADAQEYGLVNTVCSNVDLDSTTLQMAQEIAAKLPAAVKIGKKAFYAQLEMETAQAYEYTGQVMAHNMLIEDTEEGIAAFLERRTPRWAAEN